MARFMPSCEPWLKLRTIMRQHRIYDKPTLRLMVKAIDLSYACRLTLERPASGIRKAGIQYTGKSTVGHTKTNWEKYLNV